MLPIFPQSWGNSEVPPRHVSVMYRITFGHISDNFRTQKNQTPLNLVYLTIKI